MDRNKNPNPSTVEDDMAGEWQVNLAYMTEHFRTINQHLENIDHNIVAFEESATVSRTQLEYLNSWHNKVTGALWVLGGLGSASFATGLVILAALLSK